MIITETHNVRGAMSAFHVDAGLQAFLKNPTPRRDEPLYGPDDVFEGGLSQPVTTERMKWVVNQYLVNRWTDATGTEYSSLRRMLKNATPIFPAPNLSALPLHSS
jgi:hypothetical protein